MNTVRHDGHFNPFGPFIALNEVSSGRRQEWQREATAEAIAAEAIAATAAAAAAAAAEAIAIAEKARMESLLVRILSELLIYIPELEEFDLPYALDTTGMPSRVVEALTKYGPYGEQTGKFVNFPTLCSRPPHPVGYNPAERLYLAPKLDLWRPLLDAAKGRRRT